MNNNESAVTSPERSAFRALYDQAVAEINLTRGNSLIGDFYDKIRNAIFEAGCLALADAVTDTRRMLTVSAPCGSGKTSFSYALAAAVTRLAEGDPSAPYGVVFLVERRDQADKTYRELEALLPGQVKVWTEDHDVSCANPEKVKNPAARFSKSDLQHAPVAVVTHAFYLDKNGHQARTVIRNGTRSQRALTIVDEVPDEAPSKAITLGDTQKVREALVDCHPEIKPHLDRLFQFMEQCTYGPKNQLFRPGIDLPWSDVQRDFYWFKSKDAELMAKAKASVEGATAFFNFAKGLAEGRGWAATDGLQATFYAYEPRLVIDRAAGTVLLDATADIDGRSAVVPWRVEIETPQASYDNLEIFLIPQHTKTQLRKFFKKVTNRRAYENWMKETILQHMAPTEKGLVVCKLALFENKNVPWWSEDDERFNNPDNYTKGFQWDFEGRKLCATHYGTGIGSNDWKDAGVVFLFDEFIIPKAAAICTTQGLRAQRADQGDLGAMKTLNSKPAGVTNISDGHVLRQIRQLALRGNVRNYDENGVCGKMRLVIACEPKRFMSNVHLLFPGVRNIKMVGATDDNATMQTKVLNVLSNAQQSNVTQRDISRAVGKEWRSIAHYVRTSDFERSALALGWKYRNRRGCQGSYFERLMPYQSDGALSADMPKVTGPALSIGV